MSGKKFFRGGSVDSCTDYLSEKVKMAFVEVTAHETYIRSGHLINISVSFFVKKTNSLPQKCPRPPTTKRH